MDRPLFHARSDSRWQAHPVFHAQLKPGASKVRFVVERPSVSVQ